ncbi:MAG: ATP-binding cassette domain-containing protein [Actinomycetota bacterium]|nr:ATP-binding cassette domain-containing protein [Actinomycetota bacterium]
MSATASSPPGTTTTTEALEAVAIRKAYGPIVALHEVDLRLGRGEVLGLIGDNGAGKSTLIKVLTGYHRPDAGQLRLGGEEVSLRSVSHARELGIETVFQDLALIDQLPVYLNMFLNKEPRRPFPFLDKRRMRTEARDHRDSMGVRLPSVDTEVGLLSGGQRQAIAIARAVYSDARVFLLDEPLAAMGAKESAIILDLLHQLRRRGDVSIILIAHNFAHVVDVCDRINLLRHGRIDVDLATADTSVHELTDLVAAEYRRTTEPSGRAPSIDLTGRDATAPGE